MKVDGGVSVDTVVRARPRLVQPPLEGCVLTPQRLFLLLLARPAARGDNASHCTCGPFSIVPDFGVSQRLRLSQAGKVLGILTATLGLGLAAPPCRFDSQACPRLAGGIVLRSSTNRNVSSCAFLL